MRKISGKIILLPVAAAVVLGGWWVYQKKSVQENVVSYSTQAAKLGDMRSVISATGTVEPEELVNVGAQVGGRIITLGRDSHGKTIDYCSVVTEGMVLANIDDALYDAEYKQCLANVEQSTAALDNLEANIALNQAKLELAKANWERAQLLNPQKVMSASDYDSAKADFLVAEANVRINSADVSKAKAALDAAQANLSKAKWNLDYCVIKSPVNGVIIDRRVNIGQTVNSSMSAPSLFLIAKDLKRMQVWVSVNEADVGQIAVGQEVTFTVDAFQNRVFTGKVQKIRLNATMSQNVVTFVAEIVTDNSDGTLLPYLTANVDFILAERKNTLYVPNAALRFKPSNVPEHTAMPELKANEQLVWVLENNQPQPVVVQAGLNDGVNTEVLSGKLTPGTEVIVGQQTVAAAAEVKSGNSGSPFLPKPPHSNSKK